MKDVILNQHEQITRSLAVNKNVKVTGEFDSIVFGCIGGSGHPGDLLNALGLPKVPLYVHRDYDLPLNYLAHIGLKNPLVLLSSYSGNTEEPLTGYQAAEKAGLARLVSTSGGLLREWAERDNVPIITIDFPGMQPRHTLLAAMTGIYATLRNSGLVDNIDDEFLDTARMLSEKTPTLGQAAQELATKIKGKVPIFTSSDKLGFATKNFKIQTNENAKHPAFWSTFPELNHNEMLGFSKLKEMNNPNTFIAVMLHDPADHPRNTARMQVTADLYREWGVQVFDFTAEGSTPLEKIFYTVTFGLWTTYHLAVAYGIDPVPVDGVENFKARLAEIAGKI